MKGRLYLHRWLLAIWLLIACGTAYAYTQATPPSAWRTTPTLSADIQPAYQFRSTSAYIPTVNVTVYTPGCSSPAGGPSRAKKDIWGDEPDDPEISVVDTPLGEPFVLLLMAMIYLGWRHFRRRHGCCAQGQRLVQRYSNLAVCD